MTDDLLPKELDRYCFIDTETKALPWTAGTADEGVDTCGAYRYRRCAKVIMVQYAIGDGPVCVRDRWHQDGIVDLPPALLDFHERAEAGEAWYVAWNAQFDRLMLSTIPDFVVRPNMVIDAMAQGAASNLPGKLEGASRAIGRHGKQSDGKDLIRMFTGADWETNTPKTRPVEWERFKSYGGQDIVELREVFKSTRPLPRREWEEYWVSERINDRGMMVDLDFVERCALIADANRARLNVAMKALTEGTITKVTQRDRIANFLYDNCEQSKARDALVKAWTPEDEVTGEDDELVPAKLSIAEDRLKTFIAFFEKLDEEQGLTDDEALLLDLAEARLTGASSTPAKFGKIMDQHDEGAVLGQYTFNGAQQTGRYSSRGVQVHNLVRASLTDKAHPERELEVIELINQLELPP